MESNFTKLSFERAVRLFREWGFLVEEGPGHEEVTLIIEGPAHRSCHVFTVAQLPQIAASALQVRRKKSVIETRQSLSWHYHADASYHASQRMLH